MELHMYATPQSSQKETKQSSAHATILYIIQGTTCISQFMTDCYKLRIIQGYSVYQILSNLTSKFSFFLYRCQHHQRRASLIVDALAIGGKTTCNLLHNKYFIPTRLSSCYWLSSSDVLYAWIQTDIPTTNTVWVRTLNTTRSSHRISSLYYTR